MKKIIIANILIFITASSVFAACTVNGNKISNVMIENDTSSSEVVKKHYVYAAVDPGTLIGDNYKVVTNPITGKKWLDRNLGALEPCISTNGTEGCYGSLFQWGRTADMHHCARTKGLELGCFDKSEVRAGSVKKSESVFMLRNDWDRKFVIPDVDSATGNWFHTEDNSYWEGMGATYNPCPSGFHVPSAGEFLQEMKTWDSLTYSGAFNSVLRIGVNGIRDAKTGNVIQTGLSGGTVSLWTSTMKDNLGSAVIIKSNTANITQETLANGMGIRCIEHY